MVSREFSGCRPDSEVRNATVRGDWKIYWLVLYEKVQKALDNVFMGIAVKRVLTVAVT